MNTHKIIDKLLLLEQQQVFSRYPIKLIRKLVAGSVKFSSDFTYEDLISAVVKKDMMGKPVHHTNDTRLPYPRMMFEFFYNAGNPKEDESVRRLNVLLVQNPYELFEDYHIGVPDAAKCSDSPSDDFVAFIFGEKRIDHQWEWTLANTTICAHFVNNEHIDLVNAQAENAMTPYIKENGGYVVKRRDSEVMLGGFTPISLAAYEEKGGLVDGQAASGVITSIYCILTLLNCKNIGAETVHPPEKLQKKRAKLNHTPLFSYKTLCLDMNKKKYACSNKPHQGGSTRVHLCRGHFKRYTKEAPLMGKHTGLYWWQPQVRGSHKHGAIEKNYKVK
jgi:hypothetical protein